MKITKNGINKVRAHIPQLTNNLSDNDIRQIIKRVGYKNVIQEIKTLQNP